MSASDPGATIKDERVNGIIADYLKAIERSEVPDRAALLSRHAEFAKELSAFFADHDGFRRVAAPLADALTLPPGESLAAPASGPTVRYFGDYELLEEIARGGMGVVYKARQMSLKRPVALKMILAGELATPEARQRFRAEAEAAANLQHPNIVAIHEVGEHQGQQYFSMDFVAGKNLAELVRGNPLSAERAASYVKMVAEAVHFAHQRGTAAPRLEAPERADRRGRPAADHRFWACQTCRDRQRPNADGRRPRQPELHAAGAGLLASGRGRAAKRCLFAWCHSLRTTDRPPAVPRCDGIRDAVPGDPVAAGLAAETESGRPAGSGDDLPQVPRKASPAPLPLRARAGGGVGPISQP